MAIKLPEELNAELSQSLTESMERGKGARLRAIAGSIFVLGPSVTIIALNIGLSESFYIAVTIAAATLCIVWAIMSMSASLNAQFDVLTKIIWYYAEDEPEFVVETDGLAAFLR